MNVNKCLLWAENISCPFLEDNTYCNLLHENICDLEEDECRAELNAYAQSNSPY